MKTRSPAHNPASCILHPPLFGLLALTAALSPHPVDAKWLPSNIEEPIAFEAAGQLSADGRAATLTFKALADSSCPDGTVIDVEVTLMQESTGAVATGRWVSACGVVAALEVDVHSVADTGPFAPGTATACAERHIRQNGQVTDTFDWCRSVELIAK